MDGAKGAESICTGSLITDGGVCVGGGVRGSQLSTASAELESFFLSS